MHWLKNGPYHTTVMERNFLRLMAGLNDPEETFFNPFSRLKYHHEN